MSSEKIVINGSTGAIPALQGFSCQFLYTLYCLLDTGTSHAYFQPEIFEDLTIFDSADQVREVIQIKAYTEQLTLSHLSPQQKSGFLRRTVTMAKQHPAASFKLVSFGSVGSELANAWNGEGPDRNRVRKKLKDYDYSEQAIAILFQRLTLLPCNKQELKKAVLESLHGNSMLAGQPERAYELLIYWIYRASERQERLTHEGVLKKLTDVGRYLRARETHHQEWFTTIEPLEHSILDDERKNELLREFHEGTAARYEHILAEADVLRREKLESIDRTFRDVGVVIVHGASGQGKSTLGFRYLHDYVPPLWGFWVKAVQDRHHALSTATALIGHADAIGVPMTIYLDVSPIDTNWTELVRTLAAHRNLRVLVTIREEDWKRSSLSAANFRFTDLPLDFDEAEARQIYDALVAREHRTCFLSFEEVWRRFDQAGPLLEFVHLVTQDQSLRERLRSQVNRIEDEVRSQQCPPEELRLLRLVAVASAYGARINLPLLGQDLKLPTLRRSIDLFEREYLLRLSDDQRFIAGLHPIRSSILVDLLTEEFICPWERVAEDCLPLIAESDLEVFLLHAFSRRPMQSPTLLKKLHTWNLRTWTGIGGVLRALLWLGLKQYVKANEALIREVAQEYGDGWWFILDMDLAELLDPDNHPIESIFDILSATQGPEHKQKRKQFLERQSPKSAAFRHAQNWLKSLIQPPESPVIDEAWNSAAETLFWIGWLNQESPARDWMTEALFTPLLGKLPIEILADLVYSRSLVGGAQFQLWLDKHRERLLDMFRQATDTPVVQDDGETIKAHFVVRWNLFEGVPEKSKDEEKKDFIHEAGIQRVKILRNLIPDRAKYGCQGYGHHLGLLKALHDDSAKCIPFQNLPPKWATGLNSTVHALADYEFRPASWKVYARSIIELRIDCLARLRELRKGLEAHFRHKKLVNLLHDYLDASAWDRCIKQIGRLPLLPRDAVDEWGFVSETSKERSESMGQANSQSQITSRLLPLRRYRCYQKALNNYSTGLMNLLKQIQPFLIVNPALSKNTAANQKVAVKAIAVANNLRIDDKNLPIYNLLESWKILPLMQRRFREHFERFIASQETAHIEYEEKEIIRVVWCLVHAFVYEPERQVIQPEKTFTERFDYSLTWLRKALKKRFLREVAQGREIRIFSETIPWDGRPALWLAIDSTDPKVSYSSLEPVIMIFKEVFKNIHQPQPAYYALNIYWPLVVIVPLVKGKSLDQKAWSLPSSKFLSDELGGIKQWDVFLRPIPADLWKQTGFIKWQHPRLEPVNRLEQALSTLYLLAYHILDFKRLPEADGFGHTLLQNYVSDLQNIFSQHFQQILNTATEMIEYFNTLPDHEKETRSTLQEAIRLLLEICSNPLPMTDLNGQFELRREDIQDWANRLEQGLILIHAIKLNWAAGILD